MTIERDGGSDGEGRTGRGKPGRGPWKSVTALATLVVLAAMTGCGRDAAAGPALVHTEESPEGLARTVLDAIADDDAGALRDAMVSGEEYRALFWPELPESDDMPFEAAWQMNEANSRKSRNNVLSEFGGTRFELVSLEFPGGEERYPGFTLHFDARMTVRRVEDGRTGTLDILSVVAERNGRWKALNYHDD